MFETYLSEQTMPINELKPEHDGKGVTIGGAILDVREIMTKNGQKMAFVKMEDQHGDLELILFPNSYQQTVGLWERDRVVLVRGKISAKDREGNLGEEVKIMVDDAREITAEQAQGYQATGRKLKLPGQGGGKRAAMSAGRPKAAVVAAIKPGATPRVYVRLANGADQQLLLQLKQAIDEHTGETEVVLVLGAPDSKQIIKLPMRISSNEQALSRLRDLAGATNIKVQ
jgi:DNA polymerase-3 subunit alpha